MANRSVVFFSDTHVGSTVGLWPGVHRVEGGGEYAANEYQRWLMACWQEMVAEVRRLEPKPVVVLNGDSIQGVNVRDGQLVTANVSVQQKAALTLLTPIREEAAAFYMIRGTEWHDGKAADNVELLAQSLDTVVDPATGQHTWWELYLELEAGGPVIQVSHHVGMSSVPWYEATVPLRDTLLLLAELWRFYADRAPNVRMVVRSHRHRYIHVDAPPDIHVVVTPSWQLKTAFSYKKSASMLPQIGYVRVDWDGQDLVVRPRIFALPDLHVETL